MSVTKINLKAIEMKAWLSTFQDGLWDIYLGILMVSDAVGTFLNDAGAADSVRIPSYVSVMVLGMILFVAGKLFVTAPRMGRVKFAPQRKARSMRVILIIGITMLIMGVLFWTGQLRSARGEPPIIPPGVIPTLIIIVFIVGVFSLLAASWGLKRMYLYGVLVAMPEIAGLVLGQAAGIDPGFITPAVSASIMLTIGVIIFIRFLRAYPIPPVDEASTNEAANG